MTMMTSDSLEIKSGHVGVATGEEDRPRVEGDSGGNQSPHVWSTSVEDEFSEATKGNKTPTLSLRD